MAHQPVKTIYQINYQQSLGGGELYTRAVCEALAHLGWRHVLIHHKSARFWDSLELFGAKRVPISDLAGINAALPFKGALILTHNSADTHTATDWAARHCLLGMLHMPLYDRNPAGLVHYHRLFPVSRHVRESARARGLLNVHDEPLLGVADLTPRGASDSAIARGVVIDGDVRKPRDRLVSMFERWRIALFGKRYFMPKRGLTLGIVSRLTPIKQFPEMFRILAPVFRKLPLLNLEIFGSGGYASVRDLKRALNPIRTQVRFWGMQTDVASVYARIDYLMSGLPEKEALGLNLIEAQRAGTPVIAVRALPFQETVAEGVTGHLFEDPRVDGGQDFERLIRRILHQGAPLDRANAGIHLAAFSMERFAERLERALDARGASVTSLPGDIRDLILSPEHPLVGR